MPLSKGGIMDIISYQNHAKVLLKSYLLSDPFIPYTSIILSIFIFKMAYDITQVISTFYIKTYNGLSKTQRTEWNNRGVSTLHAIFIASMSLYFVFWSDLFLDHRVADFITLRSSPVSTFILGVSVGYFLSDMGMIFWLYPSLGGMEYIIHHSLSAIAVTYSLITREGQLYTFMVLISEITTPEINLRWYLDTAGLKRSTAYIVNGILVFLSWLVARILLFGYMFYHVYLHHDQVVQMHMIGSVLVFAVPTALATMNLMWFRKIVKGLKKTLTKKM